jgi:hypothetical protein
VSPTNRVKRRYARDANHIPFQRTNIAAGTFRGMSPDQLSSATWNSSNSAIMQISKVVDGPWQLRQEA